MKIGFAGGTDAVGSLGMTVETGENRVLFDYGLTPAKPPKYPLKVPPVDALFLSHSHLDHVGMSPYVCGEYGSTVWGSEITLEVAMVLLQDSIKISKYEGWSIPYDIHDVRRFSEESTIIRHGDRAHLGPLKIKAHDAGHIPGSTMFKFSENDGKELLFTGDINTIDTRLQRAAVPPKCDVLIMESTYAGRKHPPRKEVERAFLDKVNEVLDRGGKVIVPAFAVGRTQEVIQVLSDVDEEKWLDGMGKRVSQIYLRHGDCIKSHGELKKSLGQFRFVRTPYQRNDAAESPLVVTTSGMLDGGPVVEYIRRNKNDKNTAILLTGYQVEDTNGRMLMDAGSMEIDGEIMKIDCEVQHFDFSAHADHEGLVKFAESTGAEEVILVHGDKRELLAKDIESFAKVTLPNVDDTYHY
jgi:putative mRNA 3-end processing factor